jgi:hypothetical protein
MVWPSAASTSVGVSDRPSRENSSRPAIQPLSGSAAAAVGIASSAVSAARKQSAPRRRVAIDMHLPG